MGIIVQLTFFGCEQKTVKFSKLFDNYLLEKNESLFSNSIDKQIVYGDFKGIKQGVCSIEQNGSVYQLQFYTYKDAPENGMFITLETIKDKNKERFCILKDISYFESNYSKLYSELNKKPYTAMEPLSYGKKNHTNSYAYAEDKFGIYDLDLSKEFPYYKKIIPRYIVSVENEKLHIEVPKNEDLFVYLYNEI